MAMPRESAFMPSIKCSTCGNQVEISMMGEHICGDASAAEPMPSLDSMDRFLASSDQSQERSGRMPPPRVDTSAANRSYMPPGQITPISGSSGSRSVSPKTPHRTGASRGDDYFTPQIANNSPPPQQSRRPGGYGGFSDLASGGEVDPLYPPSSPKRQNNLLERMNTVARGPFEGAFGNERPGTSASNVSSGLGSTRAPKAPRKNGYGGFGPPPKSQDDFEPEPFGMNRSETFPRPSEITDAPLRTPSAPGPRPDRFRRPSNDPSDRPPMTSERMRRPSRGPDTSRPPPPRTSIVRPRTSGRDDGPAVPSINLAQEFGVGNPYHTPSDSLSSSVSGYSQSGSALPSQPSSRSSPARSTGSGPTRNMSIDNLMNDLQASMNELQPKELPSAPLQPPPFDKQRRPSSPLASRPPPERGYDRRIDPSVQAPRRPRSPLANPPAPNMFDRDDPAIQGGRREQRPRNLSPVEAIPPSPRFPPSPERTMDYRRDPAIQPARRDCKSCGLAIKGKSISSADGRLTGRYHKACFVCTTCREPFSSAEFYVLDDKPYCELHYHKLNGSLCGSCGDGIEGQYLEDEGTQKKHHPGCFKCRDCGKVLNDGYFEVNGEAFCEKDAWRRVQQPWMAPPPASGPSRKGSMGSTLGLPSGPGGRRGPGLPSGNRLALPRPRMEKRMTRLGML